MFAKVKATFDGFEAEFEVEADKAEIVKSVMGLINYLKDAGFKAPEPMSVTVQGGGNRGGGGKKSEFKFDAEKKRLYLFPNYVLTKDDKGAAFKEKVKEIVGAFPAFIHENSNANDFAGQGKDGKGLFYYQVPLLHGPALYAEPYFANWDKPELPEVTNG